MGLGTSRRPPLSQKTRRIVSNSTYLHVPTCVTGVDDAKIFERRRRTLTARARPKTRHRMSSVVLGTSSRPPFSRKTRRIFSNIIDINVRTFVLGDNDANIFEPYNIRYDACVWEYTKTLNVMTAVRIFVRISWREPRNKRMYRENLIRTIGGPQIRPRFIIRGCMAFWSE